MKNELGRFDVTHLTAGAIERIGRDMVAVTPAEGTERTSGATRVTGTLPELDASRRLLSE